MRRATRFLEFKIWKIEPFSKLCKPNIS